MIGRRYFLDTNAIVQILAGNKELLTLLFDADYVATSIICELEFLSFPSLPREDAELFRQFLEQIDVINLTAEDLLLKDKIIELRATRKLKLPDAIIAASSAISECSLITADQQLLKVGELDVQGFEI